MINKYLSTLFIILIISCDVSEPNISDEEIIMGCTDIRAKNFNSLANVNDESCEYLGCMDTQSVNFDSLATIDDGNCLSYNQIPQGYLLNWNDEFNIDSLDQRFWNIEIMGPGANNNESQSYTNNPDNISVNNGYLYIRAKKDNPFDPNQPGYTSGRINTKSKIELQYGYWEIRAKLPYGIGTWPAIWMLNSKIDSIGWPNCGEIDIMEHVGYDPDRIFFSIHNADLYGNVGGTNQQGIFNYNGIENDFHTYAIEWDSTSIKGYVDNNLFYNYNRSEISNYNSWPYDSPFFLIINLAIGGEWGGQQGIDNSIFPASFIVDYVRMFKKQDS
tara:strand:+ start:70 stop:1059 length:990 start_codon:yes stop_codon:yes gene_type:complete